MIFRIAIFSTLIALNLLAAPNKTEAIRELSKENSYQAGVKAMTDHLPDVAIPQFKATLENKNLSENARSYGVLALAEAMIQASLAPLGSDKLASDAIRLLDSPSLKDLPSSPVWKAEALIALGQYQEAEAALAAIPTSYPRHSEIQLARIRLLITLGRTDHALKILKELKPNTATNKPSADTRNSARLLEAEIHLNQGDLPLSLQAINSIDSQTPAITQLREYLRARLFLAENKAVNAINLFRSLISQPDHLSKRIYNACTLGLADALIANQQPDEAITTLQEYIEKHPNSSILQPIFHRLAGLLTADLPADNDSMQKLISWSGESKPMDNALYVAGETADAIHPYQAPASEYDDLVTLSLYLRAQLLARSSDTNKHLQAMALLNHLRIQHPAYSLPPSELYLQLASASLLDTAEIQLVRQQKQQAAYTLAAMQKVAFSPRLKDQASFLLGFLRAENKDYKGALAEFKKASESTSIDIAEAANINTGITALLSSNLKAFDQILATANRLEIRNSLKLERALWKCRNQDLSGRQDLETFIISHLGHARENEARMALAAACVDITPADIILAKAQLDKIDPRLTDATSQYQITRIRIRAEELTQNWNEAVAAAEKFIREFPEDQRIANIMLKQGEAYYHNEDFNRARQISQNINTQFPQSPYAPYARFYTAMAARLGGTTQAREESVALFQKIIDSKHDLATEARIQQSRLLIDLRRYDEAEVTLKPLVSSKNTSPPVFRDAGVLMADCLHRQASTDPKKYQQAIDIYKQLLTDKTLSLAWKNRINFLQGQTLESMNKRTEALKSYYGVIIQSRAPKTKEGYEVEWFWFYRCGFKALSILESQKRWEAAVNLARRIAAFDGPRAEEASKRAHNLAKQHMIWEEEKNPPQAIELPND